MTRTATGSILLSALALLPGIAVAQQGVSADPEMVSPRFGHSTVPGVSNPSVDVKNTVRFGAFLQYQRNPVTGYRLDEEIGAIVANRLVAQLGVSWDAARWTGGASGVGGGVSFRVVVPGMVNAGTEIPDFEASGFGLGDISVGLTIVPVDTTYFALGIKGDAHFPTGRARAFMGEPGIRGTGGLSAMLKTPYFDLTGDASVVGRQILISRQDFDNGPELVLSQSARLKIPYLPVNFTQLLIGRGGFVNFFNGGAENGLEVLGGLQIPIENAGFNTGVTFDVMAGRGTNQGYGTTDMRIIGGFTVTRNPGKKPKPEPVAVVVEKKPVFIPPPVEEPEPPVWEEGDLAKEVDDKIEIREPIEFFVDTSDIIPESMAVVDAVAEIINRNAKIKHVVIEGHASAEGDHQYNYELSQTRAEAIFKALILKGVAADRMSVRSFGEVRPKVEGDNEEAWEQNRRVEFIIVAQFPSETIEWPDYGESAALPWSGESWKVITPMSPDELEEQVLREKYEKQQEQDRRDNFVEEGDEGFEFEGDEEAPLDEGAQDYEFDDREPGSLLDSEPMDDGMLDDDSFGDSELAAEAGLAGDDEAADEGTDDTTEEGADPAPETSEDDADPVGEEVP